MKHIPLILFYLFVFLTSVYSTCYAGWLFELGPRYGYLSAIPLEEETTRNLQGLGIETNVGVASQFGLSISAFTNWLPATFDEEDLENPDATVGLYGIEIGMRILASTYVGIRGNSGAYVRHPTLVDTSLNKIDYKAKGPSLLFGVLIGGHKKIPEHNLQLNFELTSLGLIPDPESDDLNEYKNREMDSVAISLKYVFIQKARISSSGSLFRAFYF